MKIAIIDDRQEELQRLIDLTQETLPHAKIFTFLTGKTFLQTWNNGVYDLILLDIFMGEELGIHIARQIREEDPDVRLVFCTTSNEFACESYEVGANYYLHKPISKKSFSRMLEMIRLNQYEMNRFIRLPDGQRIILRNIIYSEYHNHLITIHSKYGDPIVTRLSQTEWELILADYSYFYSCTKGIIINFHEVIKQTNNVFVMSDGVTIGISRRKAKDALNAYAHFHFENLRKENL